MDDSKRIEDAHEYLQMRWKSIVETYRAIMRRDLFITSSYRSPQTQQRLYQQGRTTPGQPCWHKGEAKARIVGACEVHPMGVTVTTIDGFNKTSQHNFYPSRAIDVCVDLDLTDAVKPSWREELYEPLGYICRQLDLEWGGDWKSFRDLPHIQVPKDVL